MATYFYNDSDMQMTTKFILCIDELEVDELDEVDSSNPVDTRLFIGWFHDTRDFFIRGKRQDIPTSNNFVPYAFHCKTTNDVYDFIKFNMANRRINIAIYNFNNTENMNMDDMTYEFFESYIDKNYEISAYDNCKLKRSKIKTCLNILRNTYNII